VFVQLFARSQGQYLFANSSSGGGKRVVGGLRLCGWWKGVYEDVARRILGDGVGVRDGRGRGVEGEGEGGGGGGVGLSYLLPSYSESEAAGMLGAPKRALPDGVRWSYAPPCSIPILMRTNSESSLATLIPSLPDDPRSRFLTELVSDAAPPDLSPRKAKREVDGKALSKKEREAADDDEERRHAHSALSRVSSEEFWERMAFRQECSSGDVTGFFVLNVDNPPSANLAPEPMGDPKRWGTDLSPAILERLLTALLNVDFGNRDLAVEGSAMWLKSVHAIVRGEVGEEGWKGCIGELEGKVGMEVKSVEKRKEEVVTVLQPRKKKKA